MSVKILRDQVDFLSGAKHAPDMPQGPKLQVCNIFYLVVRTPGGEILTDWTFFKAKNNSL